MNLEELKLNGKKCVRGTAALLAVSTIATVIVGILDLHDYRVVVGVVTGALFSQPVYDALGKFKFFQ